MNIVRMLQAVVEDHLPRVLVIGAMFGIAIGVFGRYALGRPILAVNQLVVLAFMWTTFLALPLVARERQDIVMSVAQTRAHPKVRAALELLSSTICVVILGAVAYVSWGFALDTGLKLHTLGGASKTWMWMAIPVGSFLTAIRFAERAWRSGRVLTGNGPSPDDLGTIDGQALE